MYLVMLSVSWTLKADLRPPSQEVGAPESHHLSAYLHLCLKCFLIQEADGVPVLKEITQM
jgi:hypothetical protein